MISRVVRLFGLLGVICVVGSTADMPGAQEKSEPSSQETKTQPSEELRAIKQLSLQVKELANSVSEMQALSRLLIDMEVLTRAEHREEALRSQLLDTQIKEIELRARIEELDNQLRPENIARAFLFVGGVRMDELRDDLRGRIGAEKAKVSQQLALYTSNRERLEAEIRNAGAEVIRLRIHVNSVQR